MRRLLNILGLSLALNIALIGVALHYWPGSFLPLYGVSVVVTLAFYVKFHIFPRFEVRPIRNLRMLAAGNEIIVDTMIAGTIGIVATLCFLLADPGLGSAVMSVTQLAILLPAVLLLLVNGVIRIFIVSHNLSLTWRVATVLLGWIPIVNLVPLIYLASAARAEYLSEADKYDIDTVRIDDQICKTKYPIILVHGIFFRDWKYVNYWGRIPAELKRNGATIYYGGQQSADSIANSAAELKKTVRDVMRREKTDKVNIIAHSKGGLDARYMISKLGMASYVASLTTVNTPNRGTPLVDRLLKIVPDRTVKSIAHKYNQTFKKLGDRNPDFYAGVRELSEENIAKLAGSLKNKRGVLYQSVGSKMVSPKSTVLPLSLGYVIINLDSTGNDGLVPVESFANGKYLGTLSGEKGLGHGDMVDVTRRNLRGFDIREFYVKLVADLRKKGL